MSNRRIKLTLSILLAAGAIGGSAPVARADMAVSPTKKVAFASVSVPSLSGGTASVTLAKGKAKHVLEIDGSAVETGNTVSAVGIYARVNGISPEPTAATYQVDDGCNAAASGCSIQGRWWLDLDQAELANPGVFIGQPLVVTITSSYAGTPGPGVVTVQAKLVKP